MIKKNKFTTPTINRNTKIPLALREAINYEIDTAEHNAEAKSLSQIWKVEMTFSPKGDWKNRRNCENT